MGYRGVDFNGAAVLDAGLAFSFSRDVATVDYAGTARSVNQPRWGQRALLPAPPVVTTIANTTSKQEQILCAGVAADNVTPVWVTLDAGNGKLQLHIGSIVVDGSGNATYQYNVAINASKQVSVLGTPTSQADGLRDSVDINEHEAWVPKGGVVINGVAYVLCLVANDYSGAWRHNRIGLMSCNFADVLANPADKSVWWRRVWLSPDEPGLASYNTSTMDLSYLATGWALQSWSTLGGTSETPTKAYMAIASYQSTSKMGGTIHMVSVSRPSTTSSSWTMGKVVRLYSYEHATNAVHLHNAVCMRHGASGIGVLLSRGDSMACALMDYVYRADETYDDSAVADASPAHNSYGSPANWTTEIVDGYYSTNGGTPPSTDDQNTTTYEQKRRTGRQPFGGVPVASGGTMKSLWGADEQQAVLLRTETLTTGASSSLEFSPVFRSYRVDLVAGKTSASTPRNNNARLCFQITAESFATGNKSFAAQLSASSTYNYVIAKQNVTLWSPNGEDWGMVYRAGETEQCRAVILSDRIWLGSPTGQGAGLRSIPKPSYVIYQPLCVAGGGKNYMTTTPAATKSSGMDATDELVTGATLPSDYLPAPSSGPIYRIKARGSANANNNRCYFTICVSGTGAGSSQIPDPGVAPAGQWLNIRGWIWQMKPRDYRDTGHGGVNQGTLDLEPPTAPVAGAGSNAAAGVVNFYVKHTSTDTGVTCNRYVSANDGSPEPFSILVYVPAYLDAAANAEVRLYVKSGQASSVPNCLYIQLDGVFLAEVPSYPTTPLATGSAEVAAVTGFSAGSNWSAILRGRVPWDAQWEMWHAQSYTGTTQATLNSSTQTTLTGVPAACDVANFFQNHQFNGVRTNFNGGDYGRKITSSTNPVSGQHVLTHEADLGTATAGAFSQFDILAPEAVATDRPLWSLTNETGSRAVTVFADTVAGKIKAAYYNGTSYGTAAEVTGIYYMPSGPIHVGLSYDGTNLTLVASVNGEVMASASVAASIPSGTLTKVRAGARDSSVVTPLEWYGFAIDETASKSSGNLQLDLVNVVQSRSGSGGSGGIGSSSRFGGSRFRAGAA